MPRRRLRRSRRRSTFARAKVGLAPVARSGAGERRVVDLRFNSWNPIGSWLREVDELRRSTPS